MEDSMERMMGNLFGPAGPTHGLSRWADRWEFPVDMYQTNDTVEVRASVPGVKPEDMQVTVEDNRLDIRGEAKSEAEVDEESYYVRERRWGAFYRSVPLPSGLDTENAKASYDNGVLVLSIPKKEAGRRKSIKVDVAKGQEPIE